MIGFNPDMTSADMLNLIRNNSSTEYKNHVPEATQDNLAKIGDAILNYTPVRNEFIFALYNKVGLTEFNWRQFNNPLSPFKSATLEMGDTMEEVFTDLIDATVYDSKNAESEVWKTNRPDIQAAFHSVNRRDQYKTTVFKDKMRAAFTSADPMNMLVEMIVGSLTKSNNHDEFMLMKQILVVALSKGLIKNVTVPEPTNKQNVEDIVVAIKEVASFFQYPEDGLEYNYAGVRNHALYSDQVLIVTPAFKARYDVALLATAFNMDKAQFESRVIEVNRIGDTDVIAMLLDEKFLIAKDYLLDTDDLWNPEGRYTNFWLHVWQVLSSSPFALACAFTTTAPVLDGIVMTPDTASVVQGGSQQFIVEPTAASTGNPSSQCTYTVVRVDTNPVSEDTFMTSLGLLVVGADEAVGDLTVTATSVVDGTKTDTSTVTVTAS